MQRVGCVRELDRQHPRNPANRQHPVEGNDAFDFRIFDSPLTLENAIREKAAEKYTARMTAGFCWKWSLPRQDGTLIEDVVFGDYRRPWNAKPEANRLARGVPKASLWAYSPGGIDQIGCIYTAQGFEFDYVGWSSEGPGLPVRTSRIGSGTRNNPSTAWSDDPAGSSSIWLKIPTGYFFREG